jgi:hypothetical protein
MNRLRQFVSLSFSCKVDDNEPVPDRYQAPDPYTFSSSSTSLPPPLSLYSPWEEDSHRWHPVFPNQTIPLDVGKGSKKPLVIQTVKLYHTISTVGYLVSEKKTKLRPDLFREEKKAMNECVAAARARGETVTIDIIQPLVAYLCDTTARVLYHSSRGVPYPVETVSYPHATLNNFNGQHSAEEEGERGCCSHTDANSEMSLSSSPLPPLSRDDEENEAETLKRIFSAPIILIECTYLEESLSQEAERRGHVVWTFLRPIIAQHFLSSSPVSASPHSTSFVLIHFSLRYSDEEIVSFFMDSERCQLPSPSQSPPQERQDLPPHLILWLDTGIIRLWYQLDY